MGYNIGIPIKVNYIALQNAIGLTDLIMKIYDENNALFDTIILTEIVGTGGIYWGSFTPDALGQWRITIKSVSNHDNISKAYDINDTVDKISRTLGLSQENYRIFSPTYDTNDNMLTATMKIYNSASDCDTDTNAIATYRVVSTYDSKGRMVTYKVTKV